MPKNTLIPKINSIIKPINNTKCFNFNLLQEEDIEYILTSSNYNTTSMTGSGTFSLFNGTNYTNGLQVIGGRLIYPGVSFSSIGDANHNPNFNNNDTNYVFCNLLTTGHGTTDALSNTNYRTYTRYRASSGCS